jgi:hypothetical protein
MTWWLAGLLAGVAAFLSDWVMWGKVFTKGMDAFTSLRPENMKAFMPGAMMKAAIYALVFGVLLAFLYARFRSGLWVSGGGLLAGMEFATVLWLPTIALSTLGSGVWYDKVRALLQAEFWSWLVRMNLAGMVVGLLVR